MGQYVVINTDANGQQWVTNLILWDGVSQYDPGPNNILIPLITNQQENQS